MEEEKKAQVRDASETIIIGEKLAESSIRPVVKPVVIAESAEIKETKKGGKG